MRTIILAAALLCAGCFPYNDPLVDMTGVDQGAYSRDLAQCHFEAGVFTVGNPVSRCIASKGYTVLWAR